MAEHSPEKPPRAVDSVVERLRAGILDGRWKVGERLPPERTLAETLGVNRLTLRSALSRLEAEGLVRPRHGDGVRVLDFERAAGVSLLPELMQGDDPEMLRAFLELRRALAAEAISLACERITDAHFARLDELAEAQKSEDDLAAFAQRDVEFGREVLRAARNLPMQLLLNTVAEVHRRRPDLAEALYADLDSVRASYGAVIAVLRCGDPVQARTFVSAALAQQDALALERFTPKERKHAASHSQCPANQRR